MYKNLIPFFILLLVGCAPANPNEAKCFSPKRQVIYDFFNEVRYEVAGLTKDYARLDGFQKETKSFLESKSAQGHYKIAGLYYERGLNRQKGAHQYEDRFFADGMIVHLIVYPPDQEQVWKNLIGFNKGKGKQVGNNFVFYQVFTAQPTDEALENKINTIIENKIKAHASAITSFSL